MYINLGEIKYSNIRIIFGILLISFSSFNLGYNILSENHKFLETINSLVIFVFGVYHIIEGIGISILELFGGKFIEFTDEYVKIKLKTFSKLEIFYWSDITSINVHLTSIDLNLKDQMKKNIQIGNLEYNQVKIIKSYFQEMIDKLNKSELRVI